MTKPKRPDLTIDEAESLLKDLYGISARITELPSERDQNFHCSGEKDYVLKIANANEDEDFLDFQNKSLQHLSSKGILKPKLFLTKNNEEMGQITLRQTHLVRLVSYSPGKVLAKVKPQSDIILQKFGQYLGLMDKAFSDFSHPKMEREFHWDLKHATKVIEDFSIHLTHDLELVEYYKSAFERIPLELLRKQVIHNDANDYNVIWGDDEISIIDLGDMVYSHTIFDLAIALAYVILDKKDPLHAASQVIRGYHSVYPLEEIELDHLFVFLCTRLAVSVCISAFQQKEEPDNEYLIISEKPAWQALERLRAIHPRFASYYFRWSCGLPPHPNEVTINKYLSATTCSPLLKIPLDHAKSFDLSVGSLDLGLIEDAADGRAVDRLIKQKLVETYPLLGRYAEVRYQYIHDNFEVTTDQGPDWRATHLGIDIFMNEGEMVYAALDGIIYSLQDHPSTFDYGPTIIIKHQLDNNEFYTLYGHLSRESLRSWKIGDKINAGDKLAEIGRFGINGNWSPHLHFQVILDLLGYTDTFPGVCRYAELVVWKSISPDPNLILKLDSTQTTAKEKYVEVLLARRTNRIGRSLSISYSTPLQIERGYMQYLFDHTGRRYLDAVNNVPHVGHQHLHVVAALRQAYVLNTNTRYLHEVILDYAEQLTRTLPQSLEVCYFVNSGSEANELAMRLARAYTKTEDTIVLDCAYHGNTNLAIDLSPYKFDGPGGRGAKPFVHKVSTPDTFRGPFKGEDAGKRYAEEVALICEQTRPVFICESLPGVGGQIILPDGYLKHVYKYVHAVDGVCIADEVQVGFGRIGSHFWGFEQQDVVPDIVVLGKSIGNGHPMGAVITTRKIASAFENGMEFFSTTGGNPVSCAVGLAVLQVIERENLQDHAKEVGQYFLEQLHTLDHPLIGDIRGLGLFIGIELVKHGMEPAAEEATYITNRMRDFGILISTDGPLHNVLKIKPPMVFDKKNVDQFVKSMSIILQEDTLN
ncbi:MAG: aminotransferase class III-fold pyridoxal phosphate-dependent enzyme [Candidatus Heimdallarchaeota archaeon]|nr:aminotransferase class III-fold pyridoxal phosphate-dependent enzyme [Candidatus Heimdallarchaeota archaeon]